MSEWNKTLYTQIDILRHGNCEGGEIFRGSTDVHLNDEGWQQMGLSVDGLEWDQIITSPLKRCRHFAEKLASEKNIPVEVDDRWREFHFGIWEGRMREEVWAEHGQDVRRFFSDPLNFTPEGGDSYTSVRERIQQAWDEILKNYSDKRILLVTHGGVFRALHALLKSLPSSAFNTLEVPYACLSRWKHYEYGEGNNRHKQAVLSFHNRQQT